MSEEHSLSPSRDHRVDAIIAAYLEAVDAGGTPDRQELLARHPDLAAELEVFFADHDRVDQLAQPLRLPSPPPSQRTEPEEGITGLYGAAQPATLASGETPLLGPSLGTKIRYIGDYELLEELGRGGMGVVYKARQTTLGRLVALKMILAGEHAGPKELARFRGEGEAVARLQHPHIVQIFEVGDYDGHPYFSLEFVDGGSLAQKLDGAPWPPRPAARLVETLARAMQVAHQAGIVHRDLKPGNVLLTRDGQPKITDFGLAKKLDGKPGVSTPGGLTASNAILGTPSYMAPEQAGGNNKEVGPAADVYALGAILYELLTGRPPFKAATPLETVFQVVRDEPAAPRLLQSKTPRDLETICLKCLHKEPRKRYADAAALAEDLQRFQEGKPIAARPVGSAERGWRWCRRNPVVAGLAAAVAVSLLAGAGGASYFAFQANWRADQLAVENRRADAKTIEAQGNADLAAAQAAETETQRVRAVKGEAEVNAQLDFTRRTLMTTQLQRVAALMKRDPDQGVELLNDQKVCPQDRRDFAWGFYYRFCKRDRLTLVGNGDTVQITPDGKTLGSASEDGTVKLLDAATGQERAVLKGHTDKVTCMAFTPDGKTLASGSPDHTVKLWDVATGQERATIKGCDTPLGFTPDGKTLASVSMDGAVMTLWDVATGKERATLKGVSVPVAFTADGKTLASGHGDGTVTLWDVGAGKERATLKGHSGQVMSLAFAPDGKTLASASADGTVKLWDVTASKERANLKGHAWVVPSVAFTPDGKTLASGSLDETVKLWDVATGQERATLTGHTGRVWSVAITPDGKTLAASGYKTIKLWDVATGQERAALTGHTDWIDHVAFTADGKTLVSWSSDHTVKLWDVSMDQERATLKGHTDRVTCMAITPDGKTLASASWDDTAKLWDVATGQERATLKGHTLFVSSVAFTPDGKTLATGHGDGAVKLWDVATGQERATLAGHTTWIRAVAFTADGQTLASASDDGAVKLWDVAAGKERANVKGPTGGDSPTAFTADVQTLASGSQGGPVKLWDVATGQERATIKERTEVYSPLAFTPDGKTLALMHFGDDAVRLWDVDTGKERDTFKGHGYKISSLAFTPDGKTLASGGWDGAVRLWDVATGQERATFEVHTGGVACVAFTPDGKTLVSGNVDGTIKLWEAVFPKGSNQLADKSKP
jgi:eukaryotic-like serine/threonine-protein kinase